MPIPPRRRPSLLRMFYDNPALQDLVSHWPNVTRPDGWQTDRKARAVLIRDWASLSGVSSVVIRLYWRRLFGSGVLMEDGTVDGAVDVCVLNETLKRAAPTTRAGVERQMEQARQRAAADAAKTKGES